MAKTIINFYKIYAAETKNDAMENNDETEAIGGHDADVADVETGNKRTMPRKSIRIAQKNLLLPIETVLLPIDDAEMVDDGYKRAPALPKKKKKFQCENCDMSTDDITTVCVVTNADYTAFIRKNLARL